MDNVSILKGLLAQGLKQEAIAEAVGVTQATISRWLDGIEIKAGNERRLRDFAVDRGLITESAGRGSTLGSRPAFDERIDEIDLTSGLGGGGLSLVEQTSVNGVSFHAEAVRDYWRFPQWMLNRMNARATHIKAFPTQGDSMAPTISDGDVVFADTRHRVPSPPGIYILADEFGGVIVKRLEVTSRPSEETVTVRISSDNPHHRDRELTLEEINIIGRYVGRFTT